jgi:NAD(P)-dependent dehydrogenase (short-subunit alcohol dehydrogenase family)
MSIPVVLITGALTGIGRATALAFAHEGVRIVISGRRDEAGKTLATELRALGVDAEFIRADVRHEDKVRTLVWGWAPGAEREPAPGTQKEFGALIRAWVESGAACPAS